MGLRKFETDRCPDRCYKGFDDDKITRDICDKCQYRKRRVEWIVTDPAWTVPIWFRVRKIVIGLAVIAALTAIGYFILK